MRTTIAASVVSVLALAVCAACATTDDKAADYREQKFYRTGSNIPVKDYGAENIEVRGAEIVNPINRPVGGAITRKPGG